MPVRMEQRGEKWCAVDGRGKVFGCHSSRSKAAAQVAAINANAKPARNRRIVHGDITRTGGR